MASSSPISKLRNAIVNRFKPHRAEAIQRIRYNVLGLVVLFTLAALLPFPSLPAAIIAVASRKYSEKWENDWFYRWTCLVEVALLCIIAFNIFESGYAIKCPRPAPPPTPGKPKNVFTSPTKASQNTPQKPFKILSPNAIKLPTTESFYIFTVGLTILANELDGIPTIPNFDPNESRTIPVYLGLRKQHLFINIYRRLLTEPIRLRVPRKSFQ
ncbi:hypothetical protein EST38_g6197 [Candolleomyces aberdarensis]|uniref:Uncharacterized protein n=1 Tax=Candolleomyces aberdarensis TaxID=2316362 RepID=A0A4Q2DL90_9AGAR|nr:hypothetical protein EST38_g6197 [Candolleomyces aberdarensis]